MSTPIALKNVAGFMAMTMRLIERPPHLSGLGFGVCHAPSGFGKTCASVFAQNKTGAVRVDVKDTWTRRAFLQAVLRELSIAIPKKASLAEMSDAAIAALGDRPRRPLIIDEADKLVDKGFIEVARELQESSGVPVILIGEEKLPTKLLAIERVHNRVLDWFAAQPCDEDDARALAKSLFAKLKIEPDLLQLIVKQSDGRARRIIKNLDDVNEFARNKGLTTVDLKAWGGRGFFTQRPPSVRGFENFASEKAVA